MAFGISKIFKTLSPRMLYLEFKRVRFLRKFKRLELKLGLGSNVKDATIGFRVYIGENTTFLNSKIGDYSYINYNACIKNTKIGKFCSIGPGVKIGLGGHPINMVSTHPVFYANNKIFKTFSNKMYFEEFKEVVIGNDVWIGEDVLIPGGVVIGDGAVIAARAVVTKDVEPYGFVGGVPAKLIKYRFDKEIIKQLIKIKWWDKDLKWLEDNYLAFHNPAEFVKIFHEKN